MDSRLLLAELSNERAVSGTELAARLGVTRAAVWKQIEILRELGLVIDAAPGAGYRLTWPVELLDVATIRAAMSPALRTRLRELDIRWHIDSTNSELMRRAADTSADMIACLAETQSAGRGRRGRQWHSPLAGNLYCSLLRRFPQGMAGLSGLSLAVGVAVLRALADCGVAEFGLKWPNDVLARGCKLAGILVELGGEFLGPCHAVIGIGINLRLHADEGSIDQPWIDLATLSDAAPPSRNRLAACLIARLIEALDDFAADGFAAFVAEYARHDLLAGKSIRLSTPQGERDGIAIGVDERGALLVRQADQLRSYDSVEVSVRSTSSAL
jgi:BirA family biotin operon repressor/biotin-[acetyl-CoA-carboxylase] ligase